MINIIILDEKWSIFSSKYVYFSCIFHVFFMYFSSIFEELRVFAKMMLDDFLAIRKHTIHEKAYVM